jgi:hypothetical protein
VFGTKPFLIAFLVPSTREPEFLPLPILGEDGKRERMRRKRLNKREIDSGGCDVGEEEIRPLKNNNTVSSTNMEEMVV